MLSTEKLHEKRERRTLARRDKKRSIRRVRGLNSAKLGAARKIAGRFTDAQIDAMTKKYITAMGVRPSRWQRFKKFVARLFE